MLDSLESTLSFVQLGDQPADVITEVYHLILSGTLPPGSKLKEADLAARFRVSRTPVREALVALEREGLVTYEVNRGFSVREYRLSDLRDAVEMRAVLEGYAAGWLAEKGLSLETEQKLRQCVTTVNTLLEVDRKLDAYDLNWWREQNYLFHSILLQHYPNSLFGRLHDIVMRIPRAPNLIAVVQSTDTRGLRRYNEEHSRILEAMTRRQSGRAEFLMRESIIVSCSLIDQVMLRTKGTLVPNR